MAQRKTLPVPQFKINWSLAAALLFACAAAWPLLSIDGFLNTRGGGDSPFLLQRTQQMVTALRDGHFPVRWMPDANYGYGYPFFNFYAPLSIYVAAGFKFLGYSYAQAIQLAQLAGFLVAAWGMYRLADRWFNQRWMAFCASVAYTTAPFHMVNVYVRGDSLAEFWAMAFYPLVLLSADTLFSAKQKTHALSAVLWLALSFAGLVLSHNISALIFTPFLGLYILFRAIRAPNRIQAIGLGLLAGLLAILLSAWFWLPAIVEKELVQLGPVTEGYFSYSNHFRDQDLIQPSLLFDYDVTDGGAFRMGGLQAALMVIGAAILVWRKATHTRLIIAAILLSTLMISARSAPLWANLPLLDFTQFPWRFLSVQALFGAAAIGGLGALFKDEKRIAPVTLAVAALLVVAALGQLRPEHVVVPDTLVSAESLAQYEWFTGNIGTTISAEYLPHAVAPRPWVSPWLNTGQNRAVTLSGSGEAIQQSNKTQQQTWQISVTSDSATFMLPTLNWQGWRATVDGTNLPLETASSSGLQQLTLPQGTHTVALNLQGTAVERGANWLSLFGIAIALIIVLQKAASMHKRTVLNAIYWPIITLLILAVMGYGFDKRSQSSALSWDFDQLGYLHASPNGIVFDDDNVLRDHLYAHDVTAGETHTFELTWATAGSEMTLALTTPAIHRADVAKNRPIPILTQTNFTTEAGVQLITLDIPADAPTGLYVPRLTGATALTGNGAQRGDLFLTPLLIRPKQTTITAPQQPILTEATAVETLENGNLLVKLRWFSAEPIPQNRRMSLRLYDSLGRFYAEHDAQPGNNYRPTSGWGAGEWVHDSAELAWLADDGIPPYTLVAGLRDVVGATEQRWRLGSLDAASTFTPHQPILAEPASNILFGDNIALENYETTLDGDTLRVRLQWQARANNLADYVHFVHLVGADGALACATCQHDAMPQLGTYPTSQWQKNEVVWDELTLNIADVAAGEYQLLIGFYQTIDGAFPRLPVVDAQGNRLPNDAYPLPEPITINP